MIWCQYDENVADNVFFQEVTTNYTDVLEKATNEKWIICVPRVGNLEIGDITEELVLNHVLAPTEDRVDHSHETYRTLGNNSVSVKGKQIHLESERFSEFGSVQVLFEETHYTADKSKYVIWCIDKPLFFQDKCPAAVNHHNLNNLSDCIDFLWCESLGHDIFEQIEQVTADFIARNNDYEFENLQTQKEILGSVYSKCLQVALKNEHICRKSCDDDFLNNLKLAVETYMQSCLSKKLMTSVNTGTCEYDAHLNKIIQNSAELQLRDFGISSSFCDIVTSAKCELNNLNRFGTVVDKLSCLKCTFDLISTKNKQLESCELVSSDVLLQIFIFVILKLRINNWVSNLTYMKNFRFSIEFSNESSFLISTLEAAIEYIRSNEFLNMRTSLFYDDPKTKKSNMNQEFTSLMIDKMAFDYVRFGQLDNLICLLNAYKTYEKPKIKLCHPLCACENCIKFNELNKASVNSTVESRNDKEQTLLHVAALFGQCYIVEYLLNRKVDPNCRDFLGRAPLHYAALEGLQGVVLLFTNNENVDVNIQDNNGNTPLILASNNGHESCVKALLYSCRKINVDLCNNYGDTPLHLASKWGYLPVVQILLEHNASARYRNKRNEVPINLAQNRYIGNLLNNFCNVVEKDKSICEHASPDICENDNDAADHIKSTQDTSCKEFGTKPKDVEQLKKIDLLLKAIENNDLPLTSFYLGFCSDNSLICETEKKCHPLCVCDKCYALEQDYEIISMPSKTSQHVSVNFCNCDGYTPLHVASIYGRTDILRLLLDSGALPNLKTFRKLQTPLHLACISQRLQVVKILLSTANCDINVRDAVGNTPLFYACIRNDVRIVELLLSNGADYNYRNKDGKTILQEVHDRNLYSIFKLMRDHSKLSYDKFSSDTFLI